MCATSARQATTEIIHGQAHQPRADARMLIDRTVSQVISRNKSTTIENVMADVPRGRKELVEALSETEMNLLILKARQRRNHIQDTPDLNLSEDDDF
ncbi:MAG: hypothetical protein P8J18_05485 [Halieaceae bacterium]|nr:hypothetical protein [Halieaceae bacterium]